MQQMGNENTQTYQEKVVIFIQHQLPVISLQGKVWQQEERIDNQVLGVTSIAFVSARNYSLVVLLFCLVELGKFFVLFCTGVIELCRRLGHEAFGEEDDEV